ncbi:hypothetical protein LAZ40_09610 [Cereibacter sphaeroides]|uniref:hypothetical protein n=1 Tax=Cereibacter sphaeroides TaxID=1063 RepID=UPI001F2B272C|nr:hypothetical protein [Cereibacter sphaeroides]MCE6959306.1 hypothetical protein [Cereibacter sphaeroides]MCE6972898.1 hypothetical protein [Cereibacter sphaeroides]
MHCLVTSAAAIVLLIEGMRLWPDFLPAFALGAAVAALVTVTCTIQGEPAVPPAAPPASSRPPPVSAAAPRTQVAEAYRAAATGSTSGRSGTGASAAARPDLRERAARSAWRQELLDESQRLAPPPVPPGVDPRVWDRVRNRPKQRLDRVLEPWEADE